MTSHETSHDPHTPELEDHDLGLSHDLPRIVERQRLARHRLGRRGILGVLGGLGATAALAGCSVASGGPTVEVAEGEIPEETAGPYPGDGSNGPNVLSESGIVRSDITSSFGGASGVAEGVPVTVRLKVHDLSGEDVAPLAGAAVYLWHCDRDGNYSMYSSAVADENYLRGVQETDPDGGVEFTSVFPACYAGRWPHMHFEVYGSLADATAAGEKLRTSQLALPREVCEDVYAHAEGYDASVANLAAVSLATDMVFADGHSLQMATVEGSVDEGYRVSLNVPV